MFDLRAVKVLVLAALAMLLVLTLPSFSTALFTSSSTSTATVSAAADWTPPTVELAGAYTYLRGDAALTPSAFDQDSGIAQLSVEHSRGGTAPWTTICTDGRSSYACTWRTKDVTDGRYVVQATAIDGAGEQDATQADVTVDNTPPTVTLQAPGSPLQGTVTLQAEPFDATSGVATVTIQTAPGGTESWTDLCSVTDAPWVCDVDTTRLQNGTHSFRAVATDAAGNPAESQPVTGRKVDNTVPLLGADVQATNGHRGTVGKAEAGDVITFTFAGEIDPASVLTGWDGSRTEVTARFTDGHRLGRSNRHDEFSIDAPVNLGSVNLQADFVHNNQTLTFDGRMTHQTVTIGGRTHSTVTIALDRRTSGNEPHVLTAGAGAMLWTDPTGYQVRESGDMDVDF